MAQQPRKKFDPVPRVPAVENSKFSLTAKKLENGDYPPKLSFKFWGGNPRLEFRAGFKYGNGGDGTMFLARMDVPVATAMLNIIRDFALSDKTEVDAIAVTCGTEKEGGKPWEIEHNTRIYIGKDTDGVFINVVTKSSTYNVKFYIVPSIYHKFIDANNKPAGSDIVNKYYASQWASDLIDLILLYAHETSYRGSLGEANLAEEQSKGNNKGNNNRNNNSNNSNNNSSKDDSSDDDWNSAGSDGWD